MKVYRIKHKPSGLYWDAFNDKLDEIGSVLQYKPNLSIGLFVWNSDVDNEYMDEWKHITIPVEELELKEYDLED